MEQNNAKFASSNVIKPYQINNSKTTSKSLNSLYQETVANKMFSYLDFFFIVVECMDSHAATFQDSKNKNPNS